MELSENAKHQALDMQKKESSYLGKSLRVYLAGKECHGFVYGVCFDDIKNTDIRFGDDSLALVADPDTFVFVKGSTIDWVDDERGRGFVVTNPREGKFRGKFFKKKSWQDFLLERRSKLTKS